MNSPGSTGSRPQCAARIVSVMVIDMPGLYACGQPAQDGHGGGPNDEPDQLGSRLAAAPLSSSRFGNHSDSAGT
jgi:hypothetical protein